MYQIGDKVQMRRLKDMPCEYETMPPYYVGNLLIRKGTGFLKYMVIFCGQQYHIRQLRYVDGRKCYLLETINRAPLLSTFEEYMFEKRCDF